MKSMMSTIKRGGLLAGFLLSTYSAQAVTLEECITAALDHNPGLRAAEYRVEAARAAYAQARAAWYPRIFLAGNYTRTDNPTQAFMMQMNQRSMNMAAPSFDPNEPDDTDNWRGGVGVQYRIYDGGQRRSGIRMAELSSESQSFMESATRNNLIFEVTRGYYAALQAKAFLDVQDDTVASLEESLRVASERHQAGSAIKTDVLNLDVQLAQAREDRIRARNGFAIALDALNTAIGVDHLVDASTLSPTPDEPPSPEMNGEDAFDVEQRPEWLAARHALRIQEENMRRSRGAYAPTVNAFGTMDWDSDRVDDFERSYVAGIMAEWDLFDGGRRSKGLAEARAHYEEAQATLEQTRQHLTLDLKQAQLESESAHERLAVTGKIIQSAEESLRITRQRYEQGAVDITELLNAEVSLAITRMRHAAAQYEYLTARANVDRARGTPWAQRENRSDTP